MNQRGKTGKEGGERFKQIHSVLAFVASSTRKQLDDDKIILDILCLYPTT